MRPSRCRYQRERIHAKQRRTAAAGEGECWCRAVRTAHLLLFSLLATLMMNRVGAVCDSTADKVLCEEQDPKLTKVPELKNPSTTEVNLAHNKIAELPSGAFDALINLVKLLLSKNKIKELPPGVFDKLIELENLSVGDNAITELPPKVFDALIKLKCLWLGSNAITALPSGVFDELIMLTALSLSSNRITELSSGVFDALINLKTLSLFNNMITELPSGVFDALINLKTLTLANNMITELSIGVFGKLVSLEILKLQNNRIQLMPSNVFEKLTHLKSKAGEFNYFNIDGNIIYCSGVTGNSSNRIISNPLATCECDVTHSAFVAGMELSYEFPMISCCVDDCPTTTTTTSTITTSTTTLVTTSTTTSATTTTATSITTTTTTSVTTSTTTSVATSTTTSVATSTSLTTTTEAVDISYQLVFSGTSNCNDGERTCGDAKRFTTTSHGGKVVFEQLPSKSIKDCQRECTEIDRCKGIYFRPALSGASSGQMQCKGLSNLGDDIGKATSLDDYSYKKVITGKATTTAAATTTTIGTTAAPTTRDEQIQLTPAVTAAATLPAGNLSNADHGQPVAPNTTPSTGDKSVGNNSADSAGNDGAPSASSPAGSILGAVLGVTALIAIGILIYRRTRARDLPRGARPGRNHASIVQNAAYEPPQPPGRPSLGAAGEEQSGDTDLAISALSHHAESAEYAEPSARQSELYDAGEMPGAADHSSTDAEYTPVGNDQTLYGGTGVEPAPYIYEEVDQPANGIDSEYYGVGGAGADQSYI